MYVKMGLEPPLQNSQTLFVSSLLLFCCFHDASALFSSFMTDSSPKPILAYILSQPRSGSSVLSAMLDKRKGIVSPPESSFPQVLGAIEAKERADTRWLAALYLGATCTPTPLNLIEAQACMVGSDREILTSLGLAVAHKFGRDAEDVRAVVWKTPRTMNMQAGPISTDGKFIVLRRNPYNVFESQFRVGFGINNRRPFRFALFRESYEYAFARLPSERLLEVEYDSFPGVVTDIMQFLGLPDDGDWENQSGSAELAAASCDHMAEITQEFCNRDTEKRSNLKPEQVALLKRSLAQARWFRPFLGPIRNYFDRSSLTHMRFRANRALKNGKWESI